MTERDNSGSINPRIDHDSPVQEFTDLLEAAGVGYALIGGHAVNAWVTPRFTRDVDFFAEASDDGMARLEQSLIRLGFHYGRRQPGDDNSGPDFVQMVNAIGENQVDIQTAKTEYQVGVIQRAIEAVPSRVSVATPEDLIVLKLIASRSKDRIDLDNLARLPNLDWAYIEEWAETWQVTDRLVKLRTSLDE